MSSTLKSQLLSGGHSRHPVYRSTGNAIASLLGSLFESVSLLILSIISMLPHGKPGLQVVGGLLGNVVRIEAAAHQEQSTGLVTFPMLSLPHQRQAWTYP